MEKGKVYLVGAGPGDIGLITVKAKECLESADVILYDRLVNPLLLGFAKEEAELIFCGKLPQNHLMRQERINELLVAKSKEGLTVVRLKGGDPSVFGRVGEEASELAKHEIPFEIVPGITSSIAAANYAGIPVTHRNYGRSFAVVTGHDATGELTLDWEALAKGIDTLAFYMGVGNLAKISEQLINHGKSIHTPVAVIQWGTYGRQRTVIGTLTTINKQVKEAEITNPAMTLIGDIVSLREELAWFEKKPLVGRQILLARTGTEPSQVANELRSHGAEVFEFPTFSTTLLFNQVMARDVFLKLSFYEKVFLTSPESIAYFFQGLRLYEKDIREVKAELYVRSSKSARALAQYGCQATVGFPEVDERTLVVGEKEKRDWIGCDKLITHEQKANKNSQIIFKRLLTDKTINTIVFPSAHSVEILAEQSKEIGIDLFTLLQKSEVICYGEQSANAVKKIGFTDFYMLNKPSTALLLSHLSRHAVYS